MEKNTANKKVYYGRYHDTVQQVHLMRWLAELAPAMSPNAFRLSNWLGARYEGLIHNGILNPPLGWILQGLEMSRDDFDLALEELRTLGLWATHMDNTGAITEYKPLMLDAVRRDLEHLKAMKSSFMHSRIIIRYAGGDPVAHAVEILATHLMKSVYNDCGYWFYKNQNLKQDGSPFRGGRYPHQQCQTVFFSHDMMSARSEQGWQQILNKEALTDDDVANPFSCRIRLSTLQSRFHLGTAKGWEVDCVRSINQRGWYTAELVVNSFEETVRLTPTKKLHDLAWRFRRNPGGEAISRWEVDHGFQPDEAGELSAGGPNIMDTLPPLGMHYLYYLKSAKTGRIIQAGQTTQTPRARERQHQRDSTNAVINSSILAINSDAEDTLILVPVAVVHHSVCAQREMDLLHALRREGHQLENVIDTVSRNRDTIRLDSRMDGYSEQQKREVLETALQENGSEQILIKELPKFVSPMVPTA